MDTGMFTPINTGLIFGILCLVVMIGFAWIFRKFFIARGISGLKILAVFGILFLTTSLIVGVTITGLSVKDSSKEGELTNKITENNELIKTLQEYILKLESSNINKELIETLKNAIKGLEEENENLEKEIDDLEDEIDDLWGMIPSGY